MVISLLLRDASPCSADATRRHSQNGCHGREPGPTVPLMVRVSEAISYGFAELQIQQAQRSDRYCGVVDIVKLRRFVVNEF